MCNKKGFFLPVFVSLLFILFLTGSVVGQVHSQEKYPTRAVEIIVGVSPGGATDLGSRITAAFLSKKWGIPVNVINKPGGNHVPANLEVYQAAPDGYTMLADSQASCSMLGVAVKNLPFKIMDRTFVAITSITPMVIMVSPNSPFKSLKELEAEAVKSPENFTWTSLGGSSAQDFTARQFLKAIGVDIFRTKPILTKGGAEPVTLTAGGHVKMGIGSTSQVIPAVSGNMVRPLAITSKSRWPDLLDVPTTAELGYTTVKCLYWIGISGPPNLPSHIVGIWDKALQEMLKDPEVISKLKNVGGIPFYHNAREHKEYVLEEIEEVSRLWGLK